ncbi:hypothetical protein ACFX15_039280 [Malus domestica]
MPNVVALDARKGFDYLKEPDIVLWTSMIGGYVQNGENEAALSLYCRMLRDGMMPNELTMASVPIGSALSTIYAKCGNLEDGNLLFRRMPTRDAITWNAMISGLSQNGRGIEALQLVEEMRLDDVRPDYVTFVNLLSASSHMGSVERGWMHFKLMSNEFGIAPRLDEAKEFIESSTKDHGMCLWRIPLSASRNYRNYELGAYAGE